MMQRETIQHRVHIVECNYHGQACDAACCVVDEYVVWRQKTTKPPASETRLAQKGPNNDGTPPTEEGTVVDNLANSVAELKTQLLEETDTIKESIQSCNGYSVINAHVPEKIPHNPDSLKAADKETIMTEKSGASYVHSITDTGDFIPFEDSDQPLKHNQDHAAAELKPRQQINSSKVLPREKHEISRAQNKPSTWTRLDKANTTQKVGQPDFSGACKRNFSAIDDHPELPCNKKQGGSTRASEQGGLKAEAAEADLVTRRRRDKQSPTAMKERDERRR
ncbi:hypothetical protein SO802_008678 [Lithocarpus litseifolius]|uniref:Uncharacterized protein n=1 Tax=Lithocarpus litseifolius TaxID=425828 RepID=A0AAW2DEX3_9ROSI